MPSQAHTRLLAEAKTALDSFLSSHKAFHVVRTLPANLSSAKLDPAQHKPRTLFVLDSSFNPPSRAHASLAASAVAAARSSSGKQYDSPHRLLILFGTQNADKNPSPAAFEHRLAMMIIFAEELAQRFASSRESHQDGGADDGVVPIDVGLSSQAKYTDKSKAIDESQVYGVYSEGRPQHVYPLGFDTIVRIFNPKYYPDHNPPLSALEPYFARHALRVTIRPGESGWDGASEQRDWLEKLRTGEMEELGAKRHWADKVEMVEAEDEGRDVSSTKVREMVQARRQGELNEAGLCTKGVADYIQDFGLYQGL